MACLQERELTEGSDQPYGRPRIASCSARTEGFCNRRFEPLVHPPGKKKVLSRETKQRQTCLISSPPLRAENLANHLISIHPTLTSHSLPSSLSLECRS